MTARATPNPERYGRVKVSKIRAAYHDLRTAIRGGDIVAANEALDRYEQWADFVFDARHDAGRVKQ